MANQIFNSIKSLD